MCGFKYEIKAEDTLIIRPKGDLLGLSEEQKLIELVEDEAHQRIKNGILNASQISYMNSSGINLVIRLLRHFQNKGGGLVIVAPNDAVMKLLIITKLNRVLAVYETEAQAMNTF